MNTLRLTNNFNEVTRLQEWLELLSEKCQLPADRSFQLNIAIEEAVVNVMKYAYPGEENRPVSISADVTAEGITFLLEDEGIPFDPTRAGNPDLTLSAEERPIGGLGILLMRQYMSSLNYEYTDGHNRLFMTFQK